MTGNAWLYSAPHRGEGGFQRYTNNIIDYVSEIGVIDISEPANSHPFFKLPFTPPTGARLVGNYLFLSAYTRATRSLPVIHYPAQFYAFDLDFGPLKYIPPLDLPSADNYVVTIHDISHRYTDSIGMKHEVEAIARRINSIDRIITVSEHSKSDIVDELDVDEHDVEVIYNCVDDSVFNKVPSPDDQKILNKHGIKPPYFFHISSGNERKNIPYLIEGYAHSGVEASLVFAGGVVDRKSVHRRIAEHGIEDQVSFVTEFVPDQELAAIYRQALSLVHPSTHEGFGYPIVECMSCGTQCIVSEKTAIPEVAGEAAVYIDLRDLDSLATTLRRVERGDISSNNPAGVNRVQECFSPERFAAEHRRVYHEVLQESD